MVIATADPQTLGHAYGRALAQAAGDRLGTIHVLATEGANANLDLLRDGAAPMRLRPDSPQLVAFGDRLDLGDGVVVRVERAVAEQPR